MYEPEVTVITPTYNLVESNHADDFTLLVNLLNRQTYPYIQHLIIDNASTDETITLLKDYKNGGYLNFYSEPDHGKFDAMNKGIMRAKGKYISFLSCDDFYHDITGIYDVVNIMESQDADFCFSLHIVVRQMVAFSNLFHQCLMRFRFLLVLIRQCFLNVQF